MNLTPKELTEAIELLQGCHVLQDACNKHVHSQMKLISEQQEAIELQSKEISRLRSESEGVSPLVYFGLGVLAGGAAVMVLGGAR